MSKRSPPTVRLVREPTLYLGRSFAESLSTSEVCVCVSRKPVEKGKNNSNSDIGSHPTPVKPMATTTTKSREEELLALATSQPVSQVNVVSCVSLQ